MQVKVYNDNVHPYREKFRGADIYIGPKEFIKMDLNEAHLFLGTMPPNIEVDANGIQKPTSYKMLRIDMKSGGGGVETNAAKYLCLACNKDLQTKPAYEEHLIEHHADQMIDDDAKEAIVKRRGRPPKGG